MVWVYDVRFIWFWVLLSQKLVFTIPNVKYMKLGSYLRKENIGFWYTTGALENSNNFEMILLYLKLQFISFGWFLGVNRWNDFSRVGCNVLFKPNISWRWLQKCSGPPFLQSEGNGSGCWSSWHCQKQCLLHCFGFPWRRSLFKR